ncbi:nonribosomal peptide synthetase ebony [Lycorma delicatula]|uniref:nonribosomal peptide synthetase ebony n=1 Tax=Lycorma delicatula TaxID=130591 RepID=UPI003F514995
MGSIPQVSMLRGGSTQIQPIKYIHRLFERNATLHSNTPAVIYRGLQSNVVHKLNYQELDRAANRLAQNILKQIHNRNSQPNSDGDWVIAVNLSPSDALILTLLAIWKTGAAYLPIDKCAPPTRVKHIISEAKPVLIIIEEDNSNEQSDLYNLENAVAFQELDSEAMNMQAEPIPDDQMLPRNDNPIGIVLYTSGSTGVPKGVRIPHSAILNRLTWQWREFPYGKNEHICVFKTALTFVDAVSEIWGPLLSPKPRSILVVPRQVTKDPERLISLLEEFKVERLVLVPSLLRAMLMYLKLSDNRSEPKLLSSLKLWVCSGEPLPQSLALEFFQYFKENDSILCNFYGSTEVMGDVTYYRIKSAVDLTSFDNKVPIGRPLDNTIMYLLDHQLKLVPAGEIGEIYVSGLNLALGYVDGRDPDKFILNPHTVEPGLNRLYCTGDFGRIVKKEIVYEGRTDSQIKVRGHRVDLAEIDGVLNKMESINKSTVLCYKPGEVDQMIIAYVTLNSGYNYLPQDIEDHLMTSLPPYAIPQVFVIDTIPLLVNGKVDRQTLLKHYAESSCNDDTDELDYTGVPEHKLAAAEGLLKTIRTVLGSTMRGKLSLDSSFYQLGGNSLNSVYTVTKLKDLGYLIGITEFVSAETLRQIVERMVPETETDKTVTEKKFKELYSSEILHENHKSDVYRMITDSFFEKADLERWIEPPIRREDYHELLDKIWVALLRTRLSFVVRAKNGKLIGVSLNFDVHDEPEVELTSQMQIVFEFLETMEQPVREQYLPKKKGEVLHSFMMGTNQNLTPAENVSVMQFMEEEVIRLALHSDFTSIFTTNSSPLTQQLGTDIFGYRVLREYRVNQYTATDGSKPFGRAPDSQTVSVSWKQITHQNK